ncbi:MAG: hypothetical protein HXY36_00375 [Chloroflexi bacterium]|nr:hypothetical protein [Chloroflexota bacterium]
MENPGGANFCYKCGAGLVVNITAKPEAESSTGLSATVAGLLCYLAGWITGIIFVVLEKKSTFIKFHAWQSIITFGALDVLLLILLPLSFGPIPYIGLEPLPLYIGLSLGPLVLIVSIARFVLWIILMVQAGSGKMWKVPGAGDWAEKQANK